MSEALIAAIILFCPGVSYQGDKIVTNSCQEGMINCMVNKAGTNEPGRKEFDSCSSQLRYTYGSSDKIHASEIGEE